MKVFASSSKGSFFRRLAPAGLAPFRIRLSGTFPRGEQEATAAHHAHSLTAVAVGLCCPPIASVWSLLAGVRGIIGRPPPALETLRAREYAVQRRCACDLVATGVAASDCFAALPSARLGCEVEAIARSGGRGRG